jgi:hypothetical protein
LSFLIRWRTAAVGKPDGAEYDRHHQTHEHGTQAEAETAVAATTRGNSPARKTQRSGERGLEGKNLIKIFAEFFLEFFKY